MARIGRSWDRLSTRLFWAPERRVASFGHLEAHTTGPGRVAAPGAAARDVTGGGGWSIDRNWNGSMS